ncbi:expressed unknown protein [Seminavis robusta]|uniref:Uncharacterized protein n=1 Tax=Seminavis robusta TaxID=568900 RepID=A0A9N8EFA2_9STRA|nr:expressed unknown protein [Seminavis robusta]|eukprot:Sro993_g228970.1 n/a (121) ;mRNA; r:38542-38904
MKVPPDIEKARRDVQGNDVPKEQKSHHPAIHPLDITHHGSTSGNGIAKSKRRSSYSCGDLKTRENKKKRDAENPLQARLPHKRHTPTQWWWDGSKTDAFQVTHQSPSAHGAKLRLFCASS